MQCGGEQVMQILALTLFGNDVVPTRKFNLCLQTPCVWNEMDFQREGVYVHFLVDYPPDSRIQTK
jgi:hypothetical protein